MITNNTWIEVGNSSLIAGFKYIDAEGKLVVEFKSNGAMYAYYGVSQEVVNTLDSTNYGKSIHNTIIKGGYEYKKIN